MLRRVRAHWTLLLACSVGAAVLGAVVWTVVSPPFSFTGTMSLGPVRMSRLASTAIDTTNYVDPSAVPPQYGWHRGGEVFGNFELHNALRVPITVTGIVATPQQLPGHVNGGVDVLSPELRSPKPGVSYATDLAQTEPFHATSVDARGSIELPVVWHVSGQCSRFATPADDTSWASVWSITINYKVFGIIPRTQSVNLGEPGSTIDGTAPEAFDVIAPKKGTCPRGYPTSTTHAG